LDDIIAVMSRPPVAVAQLWIVGLMSKPIKISVIVFIALIVIALAFWYMLTAGKRFLRPVQAGMSQSQVQSVLGSPTYKDKAANGNGAENWDYHRWWMGDAIVYFDTNHLVTWVYVEL
jgi:hypothetical protein